MAIKYTKGDIMTVAEAKALRAKDIIHLFYRDEDGGVRNNDFSVISSIDEDGVCTSEGFWFPLRNLSDDELLSNVDNSGWTFTVRKVVSTDNHLSEIDDKISYLESIGYTVVSIFNGQKRVWLISGPRLKKMLKISSEKKFLKYQPDFELTMTLDELIEHLLNIKNRNPKNGKLPIFVSDDEDRPIKFADDSLGDSIVINVNH